ncbi:MAG: ABC transporter permease [Chloracidobacterium sp.]|uniref:Transport permease protein n=1 Tax=Chloracidobacterium validum TaxID=2821543 RepID=A0ABX8BG47_9BACT|nr:ABC transporter permease [Chloracidobacterium validum]QUW04588.1 ABC transporter permease [Chloracidobacterium validum]
MQNLRDMSRMRLSVFRDHGWLLHSLVMRDLRGRYKGSVLGFLWTFLNPLLLMLTYSVVFGYFLQVNAAAYPAFILSGLLPWIWFSTALLQGSTSILEGASYVGKTIFPTPVLPLVPVLAGMVNYLLSLPLLLILLLFFKLPVGWGLVCFPVLVLIQVVLLCGLTMTLSALSVTFRDTQHLLGHIVTILFFMMPIMYPLTAIPERARWIVEHNPLVGLFYSYQQIFYYGEVPDPQRLLWLFVLAVAVFYGGQYTFNRQSESFAEHI